eukprot:TRINITY_DN26284_c0_g2_i2.p1 TRINITY_DN26284_c0_g2~~TRINITY_DN26284_c0_g2_i2.p1  ORF type:complete len:717 (+),score=64.68 TRINITY_DN26284_c0_g2_i2:13-2163(+)
MLHPNSSMMFPGSMLLRLIGAVMVVRAFRRNTHAHTSMWDEFLGPSLPDIMLIVPGFGDYHKSQQLQQSVRLAEHAYGNKLTCRIYVYKDESVFPLDAAKFSPCTLVRHPGFFADHIREVDLAEFHGSHVLLWLDTIRVRDALSLTHLHEMAHGAGIDVLSMTFEAPSWQSALELDCHNDSHGVLADRLSSQGVSYRDLPMVNQQHTGHAIRLTDAVEPQLALYSRDAFLCMQNLMRKVDNHYGWGIDVNFRYFCNYTMGFADALTFTKDRGPAGTTYSKDDAGRELDAVTAALGNRKTLWGATVGYADWHAPGVAEGSLLRWVSCFALVILAASLLNYAGCWGLLTLHVTFCLAQSIMNLYMKAVLSETIALPEVGLRGLPAPFVIVGVQQLVAFLILLGGVLLWKCSPWKYRPRELVSRQEVFLILGLSVSLAGNIGFNCLGLSLLDVSVSLMIRSLGPLATYLVEAVARSMGVIKISSDTDEQPHNEYKMVLLVAGSALSILVIWAKSPMDSTACSMEHRHFHMGIAASCASLVCSASELIIVKQLAVGEAKFNPLDTILYMSIPTAAVTLAMGAVVSHPVPWYGRSAMTDWQLVSAVWQPGDTPPAIIAFVILSGVLALGYNCILYMVVSSGMPHSAAMASNVNKVWGIVLGVALGCEHMPQGPRRVLFWFGILGSTISFVGMTLLSGQRPGDKRKSLGVGEGELRHQQIGP